MISILYTDGYLHQAVPIKFVSDDDWGLANHLRVWSHEDSTLVHPADPLLANGHCIPVPFSHPLDIAASVPACWDYH